PSSSSRFPGRWSTFFLPICLDGAYSKCSETVRRQRARWFLCQPLRQERLPNPRRSAMIWQRVRVALLASMVTMSMALPIARSSKAHAGSCGSDCAPAAPCYQTVKTWECVPEYYTTTRTCYKQVQCQEKYTAWKCEKHPEQRVRKVCYYEKVP